MSFFLSAMLNCNLCSSGPFIKEWHYKRHCLSHKHLKALAARQEEQESQRLKRQTAAIAAAVCEGREDQIPAIIAEYAALAAHQEETSSSSYVCAVCAGSSFVSKRNYEQHCLSQKHVKALASPSKKQRTLKASEEVENFVPVIEVLSKKSSPEEAFDESRNAAMDAGLQKAAAFFSAPNITRATCACCYELHKLKNVIIIKAQGNWLERLKNRLLRKHTAYEVNKRTRDYYRAPEAAVDLKGIPLAPSGIKVTSF